ncbi:MAG: DUF2127 domain-containing protein [Acidobacteria bacterium]|nr:MAG: DUF2127 domain-containing protein [Acidobacteriota bacterium]PYY05301.1 MAG: DUF2127 domain-containing protein [Acidobacteriota bacterium]
MDSSQSQTQKQDIVHKSDPAHKKGLRAVASIEFTKGVAGVLFGIGFVALIHKDVWDIVESLMEFLHIDPDRHWAQVLLDRADQVTDSQLWIVALALFAYSTLRFIESYGLWKTRIWGEWLAIFSGLVYLPFEIHGLIRRETPIKWVLLVINLALVAYVAYVRISGRRLERRSQYQEEPG